VPNLGIVKWKDYNFSMIDVPGLIKGASEGKGL
jgi:GTPase involved in cell partitioning and DNA repair